MLSARLLSCPGLMIVLIGLLLPVGTLHAQQNLPSMGEPADAALSPIEERELGLEFMRQIRARLPLIRDVQLNEYIKSMGERLVLAAGRSDVENFHFFIIDDPGINAFAIPGGYVGVNSGLIAAMNQEEHLASVIAHEVAHVTQRHHARAFATGNRASLGAAATVLAAIIIGQASPQAGQAALAAGIAASQQSAINFTRANEIEADRIGIEILANAHYDAQAMAETFSILRRRNSLNTANRQLAYLRTHPLDNNRIAEAADRSSVQPRRARVDATDYRLFQARLAVVSSTDITDTQRIFKAEHERSPAAHTAYALALINHQTNRPGKAKAYIESIDHKARSHPMVQLLEIEIAGMPAFRESEQKLQSLSERYPDRYSIVEKRLNFLVEQRRLADAQSLASRYLRSSSTPNPLAWRELASIQRRLNDKAGSHESLARYFESLGERERAASQLQLAMREVSPDSQDNLRLQARLNQLKEGATRR